MRCFRNHLIVAAFVAAGGLAGFVPGMLPIHPRERTFTVTAHKYAYDPPVMRVNRGDVVHIQLAAKDVTHGFYLEGYDVDAKAQPMDTEFLLRRPSTGGDYEKVQEISFIAGRTGKFRYRCSMTCGYMHPFMQGELIVSPNSLFSTSAGLSLGLAVGMLVMFRRNHSPGQTASHDNPSEVS